MRQSQDRRNSRLAARSARAQKKGPRTIYIYMYVYVYTRTTRVGRKTTRLGGCVPITRLLCGQSEPVAASTYKHSHGNQGPIAHTRLSLSLSPIYFNFRSCPPLARADDTHIEPAFKTLLFPHSPFFFSLSLFQHVHSPLTHAIIGPCGWSESSTKTKECRDDGAPSRNGLQLVNFSRIACLQQVRTANVSSIRNKFYVCSLKAVKYRPVLIMLTGNNLAEFQTSFGVGKPSAGDLSNSMLYCVCESSSRHWSCPAQINFCDRTRTGALCAAVVDHNKLVEDS